MKPRAGTTLVELLVTIVVIGIIASIVVLAVPPDRTPPPTDPLVQIARARTDAIERARAVTISVTIGGRHIDATAFPDGSVITDSVVAVQRLSGRGVSDRQ
jgi:prepilin-type N-terminal cleavage/methylation domain-containing protein